MKNIIIVLFATFFVFTFSACQNNTHNDANFETHINKLIAEINTRNIQNIEQFIDSEIGLNIAYNTDKETKQIHTNSFKEAFDIFKESGFFAYREYEAEWDRIYCKQWTYDKLPSHEEQCQSAFCWPEYENSEKKNCIIQIINKNENSYAIYADGIKMFFSDIKGNFTLIWLDIQECLY